MPVTVTMKTNLNWNFEKQVIRELYPYKKCSRLETSTMNFSNLISRDNWTFHYQKTLRWSKYTSLPWTLLSNPHPPHGVYNDSALVLWSDCVTATKSYWTSFLRSPSGFSLTQPNSRTNVNNLSCLLSQLLQTGYLFIFLPLNCYQDLYTISFV